MKGPLKVPMIICIIIVAIYTIPMVRFPFPNPISWNHGNYELVIPLPWGMTDWVTRTEYFLFFGVIWLATVILGVCYFINQEQELAEYGLIAGAFQSPRFLFFYFPGTVQYI